MKLVVLASVVLGLCLSIPAQAETASEVPLENPEVLKPDVRPKGNIQPETEKAEEEPMTLGRMGEIVKALDENAVLTGRQMRLVINDVQVIIVTDPLRNRMRTFSPVRSLDGVSHKELYRLLQANFDTALDARYAIAKGYVLSVFIHPLSELKKSQLIEGLGQVVNLVKTYGTAYTSGAITFRGGDSEKLHRKLIDDLLKKGEEI